MDYLYKTYNGFIKNPLKNNCYFCYTIYDIEKDMFYSGVKTLRDRESHNLLTEYFTSSSVTDFRKRLIQSPDKFDYYIEYFKTKESAFKAEKEYHKRYDVGKNSKFWNAISSCGSHCGSNSLLCVNNKGNIYRISCDEYKNGFYKHVCSGMMNVIDKNTKSLIKIRVDEYDEKYHIKELQNKVHCLDTKTGRNIRIDKKMFDSSDRYIGVTSGRIIAFDLKDRKKVFINKQIFDSSDRYVGITSKKSPYYSSRKGIQKENFSVFDLRNKKFVTVKAKDYNKRIHLKTSIKYVYLLENNLYTNKKSIPKNANYRKINIEDIPKNIHENSTYKT